MRPTTARLLICLIIFTFIVDVSRADEQTVMNLKPDIWLDANHAGDVVLTSAGRVKVWCDRSGNNNDAAVRSDAVPVAWPELVKNVTRGGLSAIRMHSGYLLIKRPLASDGLTVFCVLSPAHSDETGAILAGQGVKGALEFRVFADLDRNDLQITKQNTEDALKGNRPIKTDRLNLVEFIYDKSGDSGPNLVIKIDGTTDGQGNFGQSFDEGIGSIGFAPGTDESFRGGYIAEIIGFARVLKPDEESQVQKYLDEKYQKPRLTNPPADYLRINEALETASEVFRDNPANVLLGITAFLLVVIVIVMSAQKYSNPDRSVALRVFLALVAGCIAPIIPDVLVSILAGCQGSL